MDWQTYYRAPEQRCWQGRAEENLCRFYQVVQHWDLTTLSAAPDKTRHTQPTIAFLGFASDTGVIRNGGRPGAKAGPDKLKSNIAKLPLHAKAHSHRFIDAGTIVADDNLEASQAALATCVHQLRQQGCLPIVLGGGHETAWGHYLGLHPTSAKKLGIINFDAHLDMRPLALEPAIGTSGTPFLQIAHKRQAEQLHFDYTCIGLQRTANTLDACQTIEDYELAALWAEHCHQTPACLLETVTAAVQRNEQLYVSLCLDVLAMAYAPGVSAPSPNGLLPSHLLPALRLLARSGKIIGFDVVELAPTLDENDKTARLAAMLIAELIDDILWN